MAIDTVKKRASVLGIVWPDANGIDQSDRQTILGIYGGVLAGAPTGVVEPTSLTFSTSRASVTITVSKAEAAIVGSRAGVKIKRLE